MRIRSIAAALLVATATVGTVLLTTQAAGGQTVLHLVTPGDSLRVKFVDIGHDGLRLGDRLAARAAVLDETMTERVGTVYTECLVFKRILDPATGLYNCTSTLELEDGDIVVRGLDPRGPGTAEFAVLGGTGAYAGASGDATFTDTDTPAGGQTDMVIRLN